LIFRSYTNNNYNLLLSVVIILIFLLSNSTDASDNKTPYDYLKEIQSPQKLIFPVIPEKYCVPVILSGSIADEMNAALKNLNLEKPAYSESFSGSSFELLITNESYPEQTRNLLSGVLNPLEMIDIIIQSLIRHQSQKKFAELMSETNAQIKRASENGSIIQIFLSPKKKYFSYSIEDNGSYVQESYLTSMAVSLDTSNNLVHEIKSGKLYRQFSSDAAAESSFDSLDIHYIFSYTDSISGLLLPHKMQIITNNNQSLEIGVSYKLTANTVFFDRKTIFCKNDSISSDLVISYGDYSLTPCKSRKSSVTQTSKQLLAASTLSRKALELMRKGNISASARTLREIAGKYHDTPQAIEARRLLSQLPCDLR